MHFLLPLQDLVVHSSTDRGIFARPKLPPSSLEFYSTFVYSRCRLAISLLLGGLHVALSRDAFNHAH